MKSLSLVLSLWMLSCNAYVTLLAANELLSGGERGSFINPKTAKDGQFPYIVNIVGAGSDMKGTFCLGALITESTIFSAATCVINNWNGEVLLPVEREGLFVSEHITRVKFREFNIPEAFEVPHRSNDFAILILQEPVKLNKFIQILALPKDGAKFDGQNVNAFGWVEPTTDGYSNESLKYMEESVENFTECSQYAGDNNHVCVPDKEQDRYGFGIINGAPLVKKGSGIDTCIGIKAAFVGFGMGAQLRVYYVSTSAYHDWIKEKAVGEITYT